MVEVEEKEKTEEDLAIVQGKAEKRHNLNRKRKTFLSQIFKSKTFKSGRDMFMRKIAKWKRQAVVAAENRE